MLTQQKLVEIHDRYKCTYAGPWEIQQGEDGWNTITARSVTVARYISDMNVRFIVHAHEDIPQLLDTIEQQCQNVVTLRGMNRAAFIAGADWALRGLPISFTNDAASAGYERWLEQMAGKPQSVAVQSGDTPDIWGYAGDG